MTEEDFISLVDKVICGDITDAERRELDSYLTDNAEARKVYDEMLETCELLGRVGDLEPPGDLRKRIMDSVDAAMYRAPGSNVSAAKDSGWSGLKALFRPRLKPALAFSVGLIVGLLAYSAIRQGASRSGDVSGLYGTIGGGDPAERDIIASLVVEGEGARGTIDLFEAGGFVVVATELSPGGDLDFILEFDPEVVRFEGFGPSYASGVTLTVEEGYVASHGSGTGRYIMSLADAGGPADKGEGSTKLEIGVIKAGKVAYQGEFRISMTQ